MISGDLIHLMPDEYSFLAVADGLGLRGRYRVFLDNFEKFKAGMVTQLDKSFACPIRELYPAGYVYISTEKGGSGRKGEVAFRGKLEFASQDVVEDSSTSAGREQTDNMNMILGQAGEIYTFPLFQKKKDGEFVAAKGEYFLKPAKNVYFPNLEKDGEYLKGRFDERDCGLILDCRKIPVVYGPDESTNSSRVRNWLQGLDFDVENNFK
jgi:hypothetical protein